VPVPAVSVDPTVAVPVMAGATVLTAGTVSRKAWVSALKVSKLPD